MGLLKSLGIAVLVLSGAALLPAHAAGFDSTYDATTGDLDGDGLTDIYLKPKPNITLIPYDDLVIPVGKAPDVSAFVLRRRSDQTFEIVSNLTPTQRGIIAQWPVSAILVELVDANMDGFSDVVLKDIPNAAAHVVIAGTAKNTPPTGVKAMDSIRTAFLTDVALWMKDPAQMELYTDVNWFTLWDLIINNVEVEGLPITGDPTNPEVEPEVCYYTACDYDPFYGWVVLLEITYPVMVYQHPINTWEAFYLTQAIDPTLQNPQVLAQTNGGVLIAQIMEQLLGVPQVMDNVLRLGGGRNPEADLPPAEVPPYRATEVLVVLSIILPQAFPLGDWRYLTPGEKSTLALANGLKIKNIDRVRVHRFGFMHVEWRVMAPDGHIYIGRASGFPWSNDYSPPSTPIGQRATIVHELHHVYQNRNRGCTLTSGCMIREAARSRNDYCWDIVLGQSFWDYKLEEQAEMVSDRYLLRQGSTKDLMCNRNNGDSLADLNSVIPF